MTILQLRKCVFEQTTVENSVPAEPVQIEEQPLQIETKQEVLSVQQEEPVIEENVVIEEPVEEIKEEPIEEPVRAVGLQPKRRGYYLFTITSNVKTANGRYIVTKIIEELNEKMAQKMFEKEVKKDLGKPRSLTKTTIKKYEVGDEEKTEEVIDKIIPLAEPKEKTLFEQALEVLCTSPYIHLYKTPRVKDTPPRYLIAQNRQEIIDGFNDCRNKAKDVLDTLGDIGEVDDAAYKKLINETKQMTEKEIKLDKNAIKSIGQRDEEALQEVIKLHEEKTYNEEHKYDIAKANIQKIIDAKEMHLYKVFIQGFEEETETLVIARTPRHAKLIGSCNDFMHDFMVEKEIFGKDGVVITVCCYEDLKDASTIYNHLEKFLERDNACSQALVDPEFTIHKWERFLDKIEKVDNMSSQERQNAVDRLMKSGRMEQKDIEKLIKEATRNGGQIGKRIIGTI